MRYHPNQIWAQSDPAAEIMDRKDNKDEESSVIK